MESDRKFQLLLKKARRCRLCSSHLPRPPKPIFQAGIKSKIILVGQAPGRRAHESGIPWNDPSGDNLRKWMGVDKSIFYDPAKIALVPMGFCYPGTGDSGDHPPRPECAPLWHPPIFKEMPDVKLTLLIGNYALQRYLGDRLESNLTETVRRYKKYGPAFWPLVHPSPRNGIWMKKNPWFAEDVLPALRKRVKMILEF